MDLKLNRIHAFLIVFLIWVGIYLPHLGRPKLKGEEYKRAMPAVTMLETGNWTLPYIGGLPYHNKPPGINWLVGLSFVITGEQSALSATYLLGNNC